MEITEGELTFVFADGWEATQYDQWSYYRNQFQKVCGSSKAVDILALSLKGEVAWLIEIKDYRHHARTKLIDLPDEIAIKIRDTLAGLVSAQSNANDLDEKAFAKKTMQAKQLRIVLHLEQPKKHSKLFPRAIDLADVKQKLKKLIKAIDPHPLVTEQVSNPGWQVIPHNKN